MPVIYEDALSKELNLRKIYSCYILFGEDIYLKKYYFDKISSMSYSGDPFFNFQQFEGNCDLQEVYNSVKQIPMMSESKCVTLTDYDFEHASKTDFDRLCTLISEIDEGCVFILKFDSVEFDDKRSSKAKKLVSAVEKACGMAVRLDHRKPQVLVRMLVDGAKKRGCVFNEQAARYLVENAGDDMSLLKCELDKLCAYSSGSVIDKETVETVSVKSVEASVYDYVKKIFACDISGAISLLDKMFYMHIEPMLMLYTASGAYVDAYRVFAAEKKRVPISQIASEFGYKNRAFVLERAAQNLKKLDKKRFDLSFDALLWADSMLKSFGNEPRVILEQLTVKLVYIILKGESVDKT